MPGSCFADRLGEFVTLTAAEHGALDRLEARERALRRGAILLRESDPMGEVFILKRGALMSYVVLEDGSRQILRFLFPGDMVAVSALVYRRSPETIVALADSVVCPFERGAMAELVCDHPRLAGLMIALNQMERVALTDRLAALGRTSAKARVAAILIEIRNRMRQFDPTVDGTFTLGLTQEEIGDATGLTAVHVNRMLRQLEVDGLIMREAGRIRFLNEPSLLRTANYVDRFDGLDLGWLPAPR